MPDKIFFDANIIAVMMDNSTQTLFTLNIKNFKKFGNVQKCVHGDNLAERISMLK